MELLMQSFLPYFLSTLGVGSGILITIVGLGYVAIFLEKKINKK